MTQKTRSELLFETFCKDNRLACERVPTSLVRTPDYRLLFGSKIVAVEIKELNEPRGYNPGGVSSRILGGHVREKISDARGQIQEAAKAGLPAILLIHNSVDSFFGVEPHEFKSAMYGELTANINLIDGKIGPLFHGRNARLRHNVNTSFSGVGHLWQRDRIYVKVYENAYASHPLALAELPSCIEVVRINLEPA